MGGGALSLLLKSPYRECKCPQLGDLPTLNRISILRWPQLYESKDALESALHLRKKKANQTNGVINNNSKNKIKEARYSGTLHIFLFPRKTSIFWPVFLICLLHTSFLLYSLPLFLPVLGILCLPPGLNLNFHNSLLLCALRNWSLQTM